MTALPATTTITLNSVATAQRIAGAGQPLLMLHGWGANGELLWPLAEKLIPLGYQVYIPDLPGFGASPPPPSAWSVLDYAAHTLAYLDHHGLQQVYLFGHSFGGRISLVLGAEHNERILKVALADSAGVRPPASKSGNWRLKTYRWALVVLGTLGLNKQADQLRDWYINRYGSADYKAVTGIMRETFVRVVNQDLLPYAARVKPSTLLFWGDQDHDTPLWQGQLLEKTMPDAGLVVWEGAGHYSYLERPADTARVMAHFFGQA